MCINFHMIIYVKLIWKIFGALMCINSHMIISVKSLCHFIMHVKSHGEPCNVYILRNFLFSFFWLIYMKVFVTFRNTFTWYK